MKKEELVKKAIEIAVKVSCELPFWANTIGVRYDNIKTTVGMELRPSQLNGCGTEDCRDFYGYVEDSELMDGTCCYRIAGASDEEDDIDVDFLTEILAGKDESPFNHCSLIIGKTTDDFCEDLGEAILANAEVIHVFW